MQIDEVWNDAKASNGKITWASMDALTSTKYGFANGKWNGAMSIGQPMFADNETVQQCASSSEITTWAKDLKTVWPSGSAFIRLGWEFNGDWFHWGVKPGDAAAFKSCWIKWYTLVKQVSTKFELVWNPNNQSYDAKLDVRDFWPGSAYVDAAGPDAYALSFDGKLMNPDRKGPNGEPLGINAWVNWVASKGVPFAVPEWAIRDGVVWGSTDSDVHRPDARRVRQGGQVGHRSRVRVVFRRRIEVQLQSAPSTTRIARACIRPPPTATWPCGASRTSTPTRRSRRFGTGRRTPRRAAVASGRRPDDRGAGSMGTRPLLNRRLEGMGTTIFAEMSALATATKSINLGQGFPDTDGPSEIAEAAVAAIRGGLGNQYPPGPGIPELRLAVAQHQQRFYGLTYDPDAEVLVTAGATEAIAAAMLALLEPGDEVIAFEPFYDSYAACIAMAGARRVPLTLRAPTFRPDLDELRSLITPRTRLLLVNSPHNPTGMVLRPDEVAAIAALAIEHDLLVVTDEVYEHLVFTSAVVAGAGGRRRGRPRPDIIRSRHCPACASEPSRSRRPARRSPSPAGRSVG